MENKLDPIQEKMLLFLATSALSTEKLASALLIDVPLAEFHVRELKESGYISHFIGAFSSHMDVPDTVWLIERKGRKYLASNGIQ